MAARGGQRAFIIGEVQSDVAAHIFRHDGECALALDRAVDLAARGTDDFVRSAFLHHHHMVEGGHSGGGVDIYLMHLATSQLHGRAAAAESGIPGSLRHDAFLDDQACKVVGASIGEVQLNMDTKGVRRYVKQQTFGERYLTLGDGITVNGLWSISGGVVVNGGAEIKAYIAGALPSRYGNFKAREYNATKGTWGTPADKTYAYEYVYCNDLGVNANYDALTEYGTRYYIQNLIIRKCNSAFDNKGNEYKDYTYVEVYCASKNNPVDQITVENGAKLYLTSTGPREEDNYSDWDAGYRKNYDWSIANSYRVNKWHYNVNKIVGFGTGVVQVDGNSQAFRDVESVSGVVLDSYNVNYWSHESYVGGEWVKGIAPDDYYNDNITVFTNVDNCTFKNFRNVYFNTETQAVSNSKFPVAANVQFNVKAIGNDTYNFDYNTCEFIAGTSLGVNQYITGKILYDENGDPITYEVWDYAKVSADGSSYVYVQTPVFKSNGTIKTDADGNAIMTSLIDEWKYALNADDTYKALATDATWDYTYDSNGNLIWQKDGKYSDGVNEIVVVSNFIEWEYNAKIEYNEIPTLARKDGFVNYRVVFAQENVVEVKDMLVTIGLTGSKYAGKSISNKTEILASTPAYYNGGAATQDAKVTYRWNIGGTLYRRAYDTVGKHWLFIKSN